MKKKLLKKIRKHRPKHRPSYCAFSLGSALVRSGLDGYNKDHKQVVS